MDTICAIATAPGGAIGMIRISGADAIAITSRICSRDLSKQAGYTMAYATITHANGHALDDVMIAIYRAPHSYTGEDSTEITCHASPYIMQQIMQRLIDCGCRAAQPGEYTRRAFLNGKLDLSQAEAVADLIASQSEATHQLAMQQMRGGFSKELAMLRDNLLYLNSLMELELDFSDHEELEFADRTELKSLTNTIIQKISRLTDSFRIGNAIRNGMPVAIVGHTNVGKSMLLNALLNDERAIVSDIHGTTRDIIEDTTIINGILFRFIDTAGLRHTTDVIENMGIERSWQQIDKAEIVLWVIDHTQAIDLECADEIMRRCQGKKLILVINKIDLPNPHPQGTMPIPDNTPSIAISAKERQGIDTLRQAIAQQATQAIDTSATLIVTNLRHYEALKLALADLHRVLEGLHSSLPTDLISEDLRQCIYHLSDIVGEVTSEDTLQNIFRHFCIGK